MSEKTLAFKVHCCHENAVPVQKGQSIHLNLPAEFIKDTRGTMVWEDRIADVPIVLKTYGHRNLAVWLEAKLRRTRAEREFDRLTILHKAGVQTCEPFYVGRGKDAKHGRYEILATRTIPHAVQLRAFLAEHPDADLAPLFQTIRDMHYAGIYHGSLTLNNLLVSVPPDEEPSFYVVDLPRALDFPYDLKVSRPAWYDLVHFIYRVSEAVDRKPLRGILDLYPFTAAQRQNFEKFLDAYKPSKRLRFQLRSEFSKMAKRAYRLGISNAPQFEG
jgi:hypothetical protein